MRKIWFLGQSQKRKLTPSIVNVATEPQGTKEQPGAYEAYIDLIDTPSPTKEEDSLPISSLWEAAVEPVAVDILENDL